MDKSDMFQYRSGKKYDLGWWYLENFSVDADMQFNSTEFQDECQTRSVLHLLAAPEHQEINGQVEMIWITLRKIAHSLMLHEIFLEPYIHFTFMYMVDNIFLVLTIKYPRKEEYKTTTPFKSAIGT